MIFTVIDKKTGEYPDICRIARREKWAKDACLIYCDMEGFLLSEDGYLILADECGHYAYCPEGRFEIVILDEEGGDLDG